MRTLTIVLPFYRNGGMLTEHFRIWASFPRLLLAHLHVIVVDDGSPKNRAEDAWDPTPGLGSARLYRIKVDVRWNWLACRNLGMREATTPWVLLTDIDHALPVETLEALLAQDLQPEIVYRLSRVDAPHVFPYLLKDCPPYKVHPNTWLMTKGMFDAIGGYDERLSGCYGTDGEFRDRVYKTARAVTQLPYPLIRYPRDIIADASTHPTVLTRKNDPANDDELKARREKRAQIENWRPLRITFPWERVA